MPKLNPRFVAFLKLHEHKNTIWKSNTFRNVAFMGFISDMASMYTGATNALDPRSRIEDHPAFTKFIENYVDDLVKD